MLSYFLKFYLEFRDSKVKNTLRFSHVCAHLVVLDCFIQISLNASLAIEIKLANNSLIWKTNKGNEHSSPPPPGEKKILLLWLPERHQFPAKPDELATGRCLNLVLCVLLTHRSHQDVLLLNGSVEYGAKTFRIGSYYQVRESWLRALTCTAWCSCRILSAVTAAILK